MKNIINDAKHLANGSAIFAALFTCTLAIDHALAPIYRALRII